MVTKSYWRRGIGIRKSVNREDSLSGYQDSFAKKVRLETRGLGRGKAGKAGRIIKECATRNIRNPADITKAVESLIESLSS